MNRRQRASLFWLAVVAAVYLGNASATADDFFQTIELDSPRAQTTQSDRWRYRAYLLQDMKYGLRAPASDSGFERQQAGISQVKTHAFAQFNGTINPHLAWQVSAKGESQWYQWQEDQGEWRNHKNQLRLRDALLDVTSPHGTWLRLGQQVLPWGQAEGLTVLDVLSPLDLREPGQAELQDIREPVPAAQLTLPLSPQWRLTTVTTYQAKSHRYAGAGQAFDPFAGFRANGLTIDRRSPNNQWEVAGKLTGQFHGGDLILMAARFNDRNLAFAELHPAQGRIVLDRPRQSLLGLSASRVLGSWLFRTELAHHSDVPQPPPNPGSVDRARRIPRQFCNGIQRLDPMADLSGVKRHPHHQQQLEYA